MDYTFVVLALFLLLDFLAMLILNKVPIFGYLVGFFSVVVGLYLTVVSWQDSTALGLLSLFTCLVGALTCLVFAWGVRLVK